MQTAKPRREAQDTLNAFDNIKPVLDDSGECVTGHDAASADFAEGLLHHLAVLSESSFSEAGDFVTVFTEKDRDRNAIPAIDLQLLLGFRERVTIQITNLQARGNPGKLFQDRALSCTITAPSASQHENFRCSLETLQECGLRVRQCDAGKSAIPPRFVCWFAVSSKEIVVRQCLIEAGCGKHDESRRLRDNR